MTSLHKPLSAKKKKEKLSSHEKISIYKLKCYKFAGLPRDRASSRMLVLQKFLQYPLKIVIMELIIISYGISHHVFAPEYKQQPFASALGCPDLTDILLSK